jgi:hypothetical protein
MRYTGSLFNLYRVQDMFGYKDPYYENMINRLDIIIFKLQIFKKNLIFRILAENSACFDFYEDGVQLQQIASEMFPKHIRKESTTSWMMDQQAIWNKKFIPTLTEVRSWYGMGFSFNLQDVSKILNFNQ